MACLLVVDDDADTRNLVELKLRQLGHDVVTAKNGRDALEECRSGRPDLAIIDVAMPVMTGLELLGHLRTSPETGHLPVILLTAMVQKDDVAAGLAAGADDYLIKPFRLAHLAERVQRLLEEPD